MTAHLAGAQIPAGCGYATVFPSMDFETFSECNIDRGAPVYAEHPSTEVLCLVYNLKNGQGPKLWVPGMPPPQDLLDHIAGGGLMEAWNSAFEWYIWNLVCVRMFRWVSLPVEQMRCAQSKAEAHNLHPKLETTAEILGTVAQKDKRGKQLIKRFCIPRNPTKNDSRTRITPADDPEGVRELYDYCIQDVITEDEVSERIPDLSPLELQVWITGQIINARGVLVDVVTMKACMSIIEQARAQGDLELAKITDKKVLRYSEVARIKKWSLEEHGVTLASLDGDHVTMYLERNIPATLRRVLEIRQSLSATSVTKLWKMEATMSGDCRLRDMFGYCTARTGRFSSRKVQLQNIKSSGPDTRKCECGHHYGINLGRCPWCGAIVSDRVVEWNPSVVNDVLEIAAFGDLQVLETYFEDAVDAISGCIRGLLIASEGNDMVSSDYSAIEGVVTAKQAGEQWRIDVFNSHGMIYEMSASKFTGVPLQEFIDHKKDTGEHHPLRKKGKIAELAGGFGGGHKAWKRFGADKFIGDDDAIKAVVRAWRKESPMIVKFWYGLEEAAVYAVQNPGLYGVYRDIKYGVKDDVLYCELPSGRLMAYHNPRLVPDATLMYADNESFTSHELLDAELGFGQVKDIERACIRVVERRGSVLDRHVAGCAILYELGSFIISLPSGAQVVIDDPRVWNKHKLTFMGVDSQTKQWVRIDTYGGKLAENAVQAIARDIMAYAIVNLESRGYPLIIHVHDEPEADMPKGQGSVEELASIMSILPPFATGWPVFAKGGWRGRRYRK